LATALKENKECPGLECAAKHSGKDFKQSEEMHPIDREKYDEI